MLWRNGKLVKFLQLAMKSSHVNGYSSIIGTTPILRQNLGPTPPQEKFLGMAVGNTFIYQSVCVWRTCKKSKINGVYTVGIL